MRKYARYDSPNMSDTTLLVSVEDLINMAMGPADVNIVNFKMVQTVLHILARQLRMLKTQVEIKISESPPPQTKKEKKRVSSPSSDSSPPRERAKAAAKGEKAHKADMKEKEKAERAQSKEREKEEKDKGKADKEKEKTEKLDAKEKEKYLKEKAKEEKEREKLGKMDAKEKEKTERAEAKEREKMEKMDAKEKEKYLKEKAKEEKEREKLEKMGTKDKEKAEKAEAREREKLEKMDAKEKEKYLKEKAKEEKEREKLEKMDTKEREKAEKEKEKAEKAEAKEREKMEKMDTKEKEKYLKEKAKEEKEREKLEKMDTKERDRAEKEKEKAEKAEAKEREKMEKMDTKEKEKYLKEKAKEEKEREKLEKMDTKEREKAEKEKERAEKAEAKEREKMEKMDTKEKEKYLKEKAKEEKEREKMDAKEREREEKEKEKAEKAEAKEKEKMAKMDVKEREKYEKEKAKEEKERAKSAKAGISIKEKDKVLIVEKGPTTRTDSRTRVGSIEVVTISQFELLEAAVKDLKEKAGPLPLPSLPANEKLRSELAKGSASLSDTMQAMQLSARVQAAETAIGRFAGLLTQLTAAGALPADVATKLEDVKAEMDAITEEAVKPRPTSAGTGGPPRKSVAIDPMMSKKSFAKMESRPSTAVARPSITSRASVVSKVSIGAGAGVTHIELDDAIRSLRDDLNKNVNTMSARATMAAEAAGATAKGVAEKLDVALKLNTRISSLYSLVADYAEQLSGFDAGLTTQLQSFGEQMVQMRGDLKGGLTLLETANNNAETAAVLELTERYDELVTDLDRTVNEHKVLTGFQGQLGDELRSLLECVEMLREQKADRDEVLDGLRDKADNSRLAGLLTEAQFAISRSELERRLDLCYDKFRKQEQVWMGAIRDLSKICDGKAEIMQLLAARDDAQQQLRDIQEMLEKLAVILGEPKAAMLTRQLSKGARCGACQVPAIQEPLDSSYGKPPPLPAMRVPPAGEEEPCVPEWKPPQPPDDRDHACHRWVGGSHTLLAESVVREQAGPLQSLGPPTKRYTGYGSDGRLYMMEEELLPCIECNMISTDTEKVLEVDLKQPDTVNQADGAGDTGVIQAVIETV